jgi:hypothetical protein
MKPLIYTLAAMMLLPLTACKDDASTDEVLTVDWYKSHKDERDTKIAECKNNPGQLMSTPNCINAIEARAAIDRARWSK